MGCGASIAHSALESKSLHAEEMLLPRGTNITANENGISSGRPSITGNSSDENVDSPPPRVAEGCSLGDRYVAAFQGDVNRDNDTDGVREDVGDGRGGVAVAVAGGGGVGKTRSASPAPGLSEYATLSLRHVHKKLKHNHRVFRICLTGGPCAGKSTFLTQLQAKMPQRTGYKVYCVPEAATLLVTGGMEWNGELIEEQQLALLRVQIALEDQFYNVAMASGKPSIVISDRGTMDGRAFCSEEVFSRILKRLNVTLETLRDRYDAVIHLVSAAAGASEYYNLDNSARYETLEEAVQSDMKLRQVYVGHTMLRIIDNSTTFEEKIERGMALVGQVIGQKFSMQNTTYYLVRDCPKELPVKYATCTLTVTILCNSHLDDIRLLIRREHPSGECMYFFNSIRGGGSGRHRDSHENGGKTDGNTTRDASPVQQGGLEAIQSALFSADAAQRIKNEQRISSKEYTSLIRHRDVHRHDVVMHALLFIHNDNRYEVTTIVEPSWAAGKQAMTLECDDDVKATFPSFIEVDREVPIDSLSTAFLISHWEMGPLYTSLAYAPVFTRGVLANKRRAASGGAGSPRVSFSGVEGSTKKKKRRPKCSTTSQMGELSFASRKEGGKPPVSEHPDSDTATGITSAGGAGASTADPKLMERRRASASEAEKVPTINHLNRPKLQPLKHVPSSSPSRQQQQQQQEEEEEEEDQKQPPPPPPLPIGPPTSNPRSVMAHHH